jgi:hypothetical protein
MDHDEIVQDIFLASDEDCDELNELLLIFIKAVLMSYKCLSEQDYQAMDEANDYTIVEGIPKLERVFDETDLDKLDVTTDEQVDVAHDDDVDSADFESVFDKNNIKPSILVELNFSKRETIIEFFEYLLRIADEQLREYREAGERGVPPISKHFVFWTCDGDPVKTGLAIKACDVDGKYARIILLIGIFHAFMEVFKEANAREEDMLSFLVAPFYKKNDNEATKKNISYFINFSDPIEPEHEVGSMLVAIILTAVFEMKESGHVDATPASVLRYMRTRAESSPQDMRLFMQLKYFDMMLLFRKAERRNKIDLYFACMRLSLPLLAVENCTNYMLIFTEMLRYWDECSPAEEDLIRRYGFVLETPNGTFISMDFGMEKYVRLVRDTTGKIRRAGSQMKIEAAATLRMDKQANEGIKVRRKYTGRSLKRQDGLVLTKMMLTLKSIGAWAEGSGKKPREPDTESVYSMQQQDERLQKEMLHTDSIGEGLVTAYVKKFTCSRERVTERKDTGLTPRNYTVEGSKALRKKKVALATSTSKKTIDASGYIDDIKNELNRLKDHVEEDDFPDLKKLKRKEDYVDALIKVRKKAFASDDTLQAQFENEAKIVAFGGTSTVEERQTELQRRFWSTELRRENTGLTDYRLDLTTGE